MNYILGGSGPTHLPFGSCTSPQHWSKWQVGGLPFATCHPAHPPLLNVSTSTSPQRWCKWQGCHVPLATWLIHLPSTLVEVASGKWQGCHWQLATWLIHLYSTLVEVASGKWQGCRLPLAACHLALPPLLNARSSSLPNASSSTCPHRWVANFSSTLIRTILVGPYTAFSLLRRSIKSPLHSFV